MIIRWPSAHPLGAQNGRDQDEQAELSFTHMLHHPNRAGGVGVGVGMLVATYSRVVSCPYSVHARLC